MDIKNINIPKVNVDTQKMMGAVDGLVDKIPSQVQDLLKKIAISLFVFFLIMAIYVGWTNGWENAKPQGMQLAQDTRSLFLTEIERDYNRKRKDVRMSDPENLKYESNRKMQFDFISERESNGYSHDTIPEEQDFLGKEYDFRNRKAEDTSVPPIYTPSGDGLIPAPIDVVPIQPKENSNTTGATESDDEIRMQRMLNRVSDLEKKVKAKNEEKNLETLKLPKPPESSEGVGKPRSLERIPKNLR
ncbi:LIC_11485 family protein [Leptospira terpstrae]|uniref:Uncharacterized protein n=1 Tax=Leptospira terpstrae serovar Hualin str. LT 11-33 = ATCC 700639 TaxID=1257025 RepID=N1VZM7_9LEPT|nr:hypothetical protein [Leptospira terpstrae]EMY60851.1 hypothetical protein LEP1GSC203_0578 [Leptospira terpstrae serovar Hualin str. LT 11-33 = ATCC 700639]